MDGGDSPSGGFWRRLKKKVAEPFVVGRKVGAGSNSPSRDNSLEVATQRYREAHEEENNKTRIKDIIRRDLLFYPTFRNALQGNSERTESSLRYAELYERYKDLYAPLLYDDPEDDWSNVGDTDREDSLFLAGEAYDPKRAASMLGSRQTIPSEVAEADLTWAKNNIEDKEIADELCKMQKKMRDRNEIYVLLTAAKRQTARELEELFGSEDRAREIQQLDGAQKDRVMNSVKAQIKELAKYQEEIAHHYAFCQEVLKRASDAPQIDALVLKDEWAAEIGRELAKRKEALEREQEQEREKERQRELEEEEERQKANSPRAAKSEKGEEQPLPEETNVQTRQEESLLYEISSKARAAKVEPPPTPASPIPASALKRLLSLEAGGSLHLPKMMAIDFSGEDPTRPSLQQDEGEEEAGQPQSPLTTSNQNKFVSVRKKQRKPSLNELFIIGRRENTIGRAVDESTQTAPAAANAPGAEKKKDAAEGRYDHEEKKKVEEDFIIVFKYGGKAYRCSEKEKTILERQVKTLDPSTFQMLLDDFQLEVYAVLDEPQAQAPQVLSAEPPQPESSPAEKSEDEEDSEEEEKEEEWEAEEDVDDAFGSKTETNNTNSTKNRRRRRRRGKRRNAAASATTATPQQKSEAATATTPQKNVSGQSQGVELGGRVWTRSPASPFTPSKRANRLAEKNNTMRDTMRKRMQLAYEEEVHKQHGGAEGGKSPLVWKRERKGGSQLQPATVSSRKNVA
ncbi:uncharacterized protein ACA1_015550 [Acanthamoeba castellanii str. Neff]|uniref:Uncharacterized protein n=1 Tax=Acanthamoeba castellanii (strain ATCC 30010 / Neff) TaxID=1257118 RepID=L8H1U6_ACACF|nr:uncharacterized protein ACA1_015550 [Acanthamoeba castellanii str. Neff]ELR18733.1 hypothetical protein ACA1_015550 [Acanthamoeba castellanii str. Neff]